MADSKPTSQEEIDPRHRAAQRYLQRAHDELNAKDAEKPKGHRQRPQRTASKPTAADLVPSISTATYLHTMMLIVVFTAGLLSVALCYSLMYTLFVAGRVIALPAGVLFFVGLSYGSAFFLGIVESTANGHTSPEDALTGDWRDWFWTLPSTLGVLLMAAAVGWLISRGVPGSTFTTIAITVWLLFPLLMLSTLETGSVTSPISWPVISTLATRPLMWMTLYGVSFALGMGGFRIAQWFWPARPFLTMLLLGPTITVGVLIYGWMLGQVARWLTIGGR